MVQCGMCRVLLLAASAAALELQLPWKTAPKKTKSLGQVEELTYDVPLAVGTWQAGNKLLYDYSPERDEALLAAWSLARDRGVRYFDTGDSYGTGDIEGNAELLLGRFAGGGADAYVHTKLAVYPWRLRPDDFVRACEQSLKRLGAERVALVGQHWSAETYGLGGIQDPAVYGGLAKCCELGYASGVGLSNLGPRALGRGVDAVNGLGARRDAPDAVAADRKATVGQVALAWCLNARGPGKPPPLPLVGARTPAMVRDVLGALDVKLDAGDVASLADVARRAPQAQKNSFQTK
ncbi:oxidoreductase [Aureococcus anophagefferens]|nr:oxidoreductase [Aureococcus anophagefferens]